MRYLVYGRAGSRRRWLFVVLSALVAMIAFGAPAGAAVKAPSDGPVSAHLLVLSTETYTPTGILLRAGDSIKISASGTIHFGGGRVAAMAPPGIPWAECSKIPGTSTDVTAWPAAGLNCWSLIGTVGDGAPFEVGAGATLRVSHRGELALGVNDTDLHDNYGKWSATITVTPAPSTPAKPRPARSKLTSNTKIFLLIAAALIAALILIGGLWKVAGGRQGDASDRPDKRPPLPDLDLPDWPLAEPPVVPRHDDVVVEVHAAATTVRAPSQRSASPPDASKSETPTPDPAEAAPLKPASRKRSPKKAAAKAASKAAAKDDASKADPKTDNVPVGTAPEVAGTVIAASDVAASDAPAPEVAAPAPVVASAPEPAPVAVSQFAPPSESAAASTGAPVEVNHGPAKIFEVDFSNGWTLRVGYNHFPKGSVLQWRVTQNRTVAATGYFITKGDEEADHVETIPLGMKLEGPETHPEGADVQFDWSLDGVPYRYSVRRNADC